MKTVALALCLVVMAAGWSLGATAAPAGKALLEKLVDKGVLSPAEASELGLAPEPAGAVPGEADDESRPEEGVTPAPAALPFDVELRAQVRFDAGDLLVGEDGDYETETDLFLRRVRLEIDKEFANLPLGKELELNLTLDGDRADQDFRGGERDDPSNDVELQYIYADWTIVEALSLKIGKHKLPFSRVSLTSSARQLLIERPAVTDLAKDALGDYQQAQLQVHGDLAAGAVRYYVSYGDGANSGDLEDLDPELDEMRNARWGNAYLARLEVAPFGFTLPSRIEGKRNDTGIGDESHLTFGLSAGVQDKIRYATESAADATLETTLWGADLGGRYRLAGMGTLTGQVEYAALRREFNYRPDEEPDGYYIQAGYLLPVTILRGWLEPAARYEVFDHDRIDNAGERGSKEKTLTAGFNHYLSEHRLKWAYNFVRTRFDDGIAEAEDSTRNLHRLLLQLAY